MRIGILGPLEVVAADGRPAHVAGARLRTLLVALALEPGRAVPSERLVDAIWDDDPPAAAANALQALVSRLRRALPGVPVTTDPTGYRLLVEPDDVDATRFERLVAAGRARLADDPAAASRLLGEALALWRGPVLLDAVDTPTARARRVRLTELRLTAVEDRAAAERRLGRGSGPVDELAALAGEHPLREPLVAALMHALVAAGRPAEALLAYERTREALADQLGADPAPELSALHTAVLRGEAAPGSGHRGGAPEPWSPTTVRTNLPAGLSSFVGRDADLERVAALVDEYRLVTLVGPGGAGKTRLAVETARTIVDRTPDGVWLVELAPVTDPADLPSALLAALGLRDSTSVVARDPADDPVGRLVAALRPWSALLVLDNCEHLVDAAASVAGRLLAACPRLRLLATSREPLGVTGEAVRPVEPLALPPAGTSAAGVLGYDAVRLLVDRAHAARPGLTLSAVDAPAVARICRALDGMPLAIELAAARLRTMTPAQLAGRLDDRFRLLTGGSRIALPRHQTLRAVVDWSWDLLSAAEGAVLCRLSVFAGGATVEAAERVCADHPAVTGDLLDLLTGLADKSLLVVDDHGEAPRYRMLETIKAYGRERLRGDGDEGAARRAYIGYVVELVEVAEPHLRGGEQLVWLRRLRAQHDDITAVLRGAVVAGDAATAHRLVAAAGWYWWLAGHKAEGLELTVDALGVPGPVDDATRATALAMAGFIRTAGIGDVGPALDWLREALRLADGLPESAPAPALRFARLFDVVTGGFPPSAGSQATLATLLADDDPWVRAQTRLARNRFIADPDERAADLSLTLAEARETGDRWLRAYALSAQSDLAARRGDFAAALDRSGQALALLAELGDLEDGVLMRARRAQLLWVSGDRAGCAAELAALDRDAARIGWADGLALTAYTKSELARWAGDGTTARDELNRTDDALRDLPPDPVFRAMLLDSRAHLDAADGDLDAAADHRGRAVDLAMTSRDPSVLGQVLVGAADQALRRGRAADAARLLVAGELAAGGPDLSRPDDARVGAAVRAELGEATFVAATAAARAELAGMRGGEPGTAEVVHELAGSVLERRSSAAGAG